MTVEMIRLTGGLLLAAAGALSGYGRCTELRRRQRLLEELNGALGRLSAELIRLRTPLPQAFEKLKSCRMFYLVSAGFGAEPLETLWKRAAEAQPLKAGERALLGSLGNVLGKYDAPQQSAEIELVRQQLAERVAALEREIDTRGRHYAGLGAALGGIVAVVLY